MCPQNRWIGVVPKANRRLFAFTSGAADGGLWAQECCLANSAGRGPGGKAQCVERPMKRRRTQRPLLRPKGGGGLPPFLFPALASGKPHPPPLSAAPFHALALRDHVHGRAGGGMHRGDRLHNRRFCE